MDNLSFYLSELEVRNLMPANIEAATWHDWTMVSCFDIKSSEYISESVRMGIDQNKETAFMKALTEHCERILSKNTPEKSITTYGRSDGFAAFPIFGENATLRGRENAYNEAVERYLWATWWDNLDISFSVLPVSPTVGGLQVLIEQFDLDFVNEIQIKDSTEKHCLSILLAKLNGGGYVTGGACSLASDNRRYTQAYGELLRHLFVINNNKNFVQSNLSFYEERLFSFANGKLNQKVEDRLKVVGNKLIMLPRLVLDSRINHEHSDLIYLHRCYFENQPIFMGGDVERLCI